MLNISVSPSLWEVESSTFSWPQTTKPWIVATVIGNVGENHAHVQTMCTASGLELSSILGTMDYMLVSIQCYLIDGARWRKHDVEEVLIGMLGEAAVAVFRDDRGREFCPDAPELPVAHVKERISVGSVLGRPPSEPLTPAASTGRQLHSGIRQEFAGRREPAVSPSKSVAGPARQPIEAAQEART